jgi:hypothetical protein
MTALERAQLRVDILQSIVTVVAVIIGGIWTYNVFISERKNYPHANATLTVAHAKLSDQAVLVRVVAAVENTGTAQMLVNRVVVRVQQIKPMQKEKECVDPNRCAPTEVNHALNERSRTENKFSWPLLQKREVDFDRAIRVEPDETERLDFEFVIRPAVKMIYVYAYFDNVGVESERWWQKVAYFFGKARQAPEGGYKWTTSAYYDLANDQAVRTEPDASQSKTKKRKGEPK